MHRDKASLLQGGKLLVCWGHGPRARRAAATATAWRVGATGLDKSSLDGHGPEDAIGLVEQLCGRVKLCHFASRHDENAVAVHDRVESVRNRKDGAVRKLASDHSLDLSVRLDIHGGCRLVEDEDLAATQECTAEAEQLALARTQVRASLVDVRIKLAVLFT